MDGARTINASFELAFKKQKEFESSSSGQGDLMAVHYRDEEVIYIQAHLRHGLPYIWKSLSISRHSITNERL
jgi:Arp2/3 complex, 34 kD subunit p34-Arc